MSIAAEKLNLGSKGLPACLLKPTTVDVEKWFEKKYGKDAGSDHYLRSIADENGIIGEQTAREMEADIRSDALLNESRLRECGHFEEYLTMIERKECSVSDLIFMIYCSVAFFNSCRLLRDESTYRVVESGLLFELKHEPVRGIFLAIATEHIVAEAIESLDWHISRINSRRWQCE